jgi:hypothetical protein
MKSRPGASLFVGLCLVAVGIGALVLLLRSGAWMIGGSVPVPRAAATAGCQADHPTFQYGFAALKQQLGPAMGDPLECERAIHVSGDTRQRTTTGYAYYRTAVNVPTFTNGSDHWALTSGGLEHWTGVVVDPPGDTPK